MEDTFTFSGLTIPNLAKVAGGILVIWGLVAYFMQSADPPSITAMIPAFMGAPLLILGFYPREMRQIDIITCTRR